MEFFKEEISLLQMRTEYRLNNYSESKIIGKSFIQEYPNSDYLIDIIMTFGDIFVVENNYEAAFRTYVKSLKINADEVYFNKILKRLFLTLQFGISNNTIDEILTFESDDKINQFLLLAKAHNFIYYGQPHFAEEILTNIKKRYLAGIGKEYYHKLLEELKDEEIKILIPVVLPLSGKNSKIGQEFLKGLKFAQSQFSSKKLKLSFIVYDNESESLKTVEVFQKISKNSNTTAILGPITTNTSIIACSFAVQNGLPVVLPNTLMEGFSEISENIFMMNSDLSARGKLAAQFIADKLNVNNIAVLAPADKYGKDIVEAFVTELDKFDLSPLIIEWYSGVPMNLEHQFKSFRRLAWELVDSTKLDLTTDSLQFVYRPMEEMTEEDSADVIHSSIDAIYMPIKKGHLDYVGAQFPAYNLETIIVGNDNWADLNILNKENIGPHFKGLTVISNYNHCQIDQLNNNFEEKHNEYFYQGIDAYNLLIEAISKSDNSNESIKDALSSIKDFKGIYGTYDFSERGNVNTNLNIVRFDGYSFEKWID